MTQFFIVSCSFLISSIALLVIGIPCWIIGINYPQYYLSQFLYPIPIFPDSDGDILSAWSYTNIFWNSNNVSVSSSELTIRIDPSDFPKSHRDHDITIHVLHNLWGIGFSLSVIRHKKIIGTYSYSNNMNPNRSDNINLVPNIYPSQLPSSLREYGDFRLKCQYSTLITKEKGINAVCHRDIGSFIRITDKLIQIDFGSIEVTDFSFTIKFNNLTGFPYDFVRTPQIYLGFWEETSAYSIKIAGASFTSTGILILILSIVIFFTFPSNDVDTERN